MFDTGKNPGADPFITKYVTSQISLELVEGVTVDLTIDRSTIGLLLGELLQRASAPDRAIAVVEQLKPTTLTALSLAEMYVDEASLGRHHRGHRVVHQRRRCHVPAVHLPGRRLP